MAEGKRFRALRAVVWSAGSAAAVVAAGVAAERLAVRRLRSRPDPEADSPLGTLPPEDLGPVRSFDGTELRVRAAGPPEAPALVFLHGITLDLTTWYYQWQMFSDRYRCVLYDQRAHGGSSRPPSGDYSVTAMGHDLRAVLDAAVPQGPVVLIGHSLGGMAILSFADLFPEEIGSRVAGVVLVDTAASDVLREVFGGLGARVGRGLRRLGTRYRSRIDAAERLQGAVRRFGADLSFLVARATNFGPGASPSQVEHVTRISTGAPAEVWVHTLQDVLDMDLRHVLERITVPALVVVGDRDLVTPKTSAQALRSALPDARAVVITRAGHLSMMEQHERFDEVLDGFLTEVLPPRNSRRRRKASSRN
ncbi:MAG: alpha/beta fold hydrolase [Actinomycetota bacterium]